ncbi:hypothetical protein KKC62_01500 [Patescibacteria group bacterium]|nr:hypothetical protein [Patescibacteria group bacterium]MBU1952872.1 hypothetical protein [Patescibacteria group bacterium]
MTSETTFPSTQMGTDSKYEMTHEELQILAENESRHSIGREVYDAPKIQQLMTNFWNDCKATLEAGHYVDRAKIHGGVGEALSVYIKDVNLNQYLPSGVTFLGVLSVDGDPKSINECEGLSPYYFDMEHIIGLPVAKEKGVTGLLVGETKDSSLAILHEIGHAWDYVENAKERQQESLISEQFRALQLFLNVNSDSLGSFVGLNPDYKNPQVEERLNNLLEVKTHEFISIETTLSAHANYPLNRRVEATGVSLADFENMLNEQARNILREIYAHTEANRQDTAQDGISKCVKSELKVVADRLSKESDEFQATVTALHERNAWARALVIGKKLMHEEGVQLYEGTLENLFFYIDRCINAHGVDAGRKGIKNPKTRDALNIPE